MLVPTVLCRDLQHIKPTALIDRIGKALLPKCDAENNVPIRPQNRDRYPKSWKILSFCIRADRAKWRCEWCGKPSRRISEREGCILTVAHMDHKPENCHPSNLYALCEACHLGYDQHHHALPKQPASMPGQIELFFSSPRGPLLRTSNQICLLSWAKQLCHVAKNTGGQLLDVMRSAAKAWNAGKRDTRIDTALRSWSEYKTAASAQNAPIGISIAPVKLRYAGLTRARDGRSSRAPKEV